MAFKPNAPQKVFCFFEPRVNEKCIKRKKSTESRLREEAVQGRKGEADALGGKGESCQISGNEKQRSKFFGNSYGKKRNKQTPKRVFRLTR